MAKANHEEFDSLKSEAISEEEYQKIDANYWTKIKQESVNE